MSDAGRGPGETPRDEPPPEVGGTDAGSATAAAPVAEDALQGALVRLWTGLLGRPALGVDEHFFEIGGTDETAGRMLARVEAATGQRLEVADVHAAPTIRRLAELLVRRIEGAVAEPERFMGASPGAANGLAENALHDQLLELWEQELGVDGLGIDDPFVARGERQASVERMFAAVRQLCGVDLDTGDVRGELTVRNLADALVERAPADPVVCIQPGDPRRPPLLFLHGDFGGGGYYLRTLAPALGVEQPVYGVRLHGLHGEDVPPTVEAMAADHVAHWMRRPFPDTCSVAGSCGSAFIALEVAVQLTRLGVHVEWLFLVEPPVRTGAAPPAPPPAPRLSPRARRMPRVRAVWLVSQYAAILPHYTYPHYHGRVGVFWADDNPHGFGRPEARAVLTSIAPRVQMYSCPGTHVTLSGRYVRHLAAAIKACIDQDQEVGLRGDAAVRPLPGDARGWL